MLKTCEPELRENRTGLNKVMSKNIINKGFLVFSK